MRTTIDLPDDLFRQAKMRAVQDGLLLKELFRRYVEQGLTQAAAPPTLQERPKRSPLPVFKGTSTARVPNLTNAELFAILDEGDAEAIRAVFD